MSLGIGTTPYATLALLQVVGTLTKVLAAEDPERARKFREALAPLVAEATVSDQPGWGDALNVYRELHRVAPNVFHDPSGD